ncbi:SatD family protein [Oceanithermus sp.]
MLSGDLVASRAYGAGKAARVLSEIVNEVNARFPEELLVPLDVIQGDAFQGVAAGGPEALVLVFRVQGEIIVRSEGRLKSRFGLGLGAIDQALAGVADPSLLTGPAFVAAAEALVRARKEKRQIVLQSGRADLDAVADGTFGLVEFVWKRWSAEVWRRALRYDEVADIGTLAEELGVSYQAVHKQLHARGVLPVRDALGGLGRLLEEVG